MYDVTLRRENGSFIGEGQFETGDPSWVETAVRVYHKSVPDAPKVKPHTNHRLNDSDGGAVYKLGLLDAKAATPGAKHEFFILVQVTPQVVDDRRRGPRG